MTTITDDATSPARRGSVRRTGPTKLTGATDTFWALRPPSPQSSGRPNSPAAYRRVLHDLVGRVMVSPGVDLFNAVEAGVPTDLVTVIAGATGEAVVSVMDLIGVSQTTFRRKEEAREPLPDVAGHRLMGYLRVVATLRRLLAESGDPEQVRAFDLEGWVAQWMREELPDLGGKTPAEMLRNPEGQRAVEQVLERMRGGLPA